MTDVLKIAIDRRSKLQEEIAKLDEFIRMADALMRSQGGEGKGQRAAMATPAPAVPEAPAKDDASAKADEDKQAESDKPAAKDVPRRALPWIEVFVWLCERRYRRSAMWWMKRIIGGAPNLTTPSCRASGHRYRLRPVAQTKDSRRRW